MHELTFDAANHVYRAGNHLVPGVTSVIRAAGLMDTIGWDTFHQTLGTYVHELCALIDGDALDWNDLDADLDGYADAYQAFLRECTPAWEQIEKPQGYKELGRYLFAGTPDRIGWINGKYSVVDIKTGTCTRWHAVQTAAYAMIYRTVVERYCLHLRPDGTYRLNRHSDAGDALIFRSALNLASLKEKLHDRHDDACPALGGPGEATCGESFDCSLANPDQQPA